MCIWYMYYVCLHISTYIWYMGIFIYDCIYVHVSMCVNVCMIVYRYVYEHV